MKESFFLFIKGSSIKALKTIPVLQVILFGRNTCGCIDISSYIEWLDYPRTDLWHCSL